MRKSLPPAWNTCLRISCELEIFSNCLSNYLFFGASPEHPSCVFECSLDISTLVSRRCLKSNVFLFRFTSFWRHCHPRWLIHFTSSSYPILPFPFTHIESEWLLGSDSLSTCLSSPFSPYTSLLLWINSQSSKVGFMQQPYTFFFYLCSCPSQIHTRLWFYWASKYYLNSFIWKMQILIVSLWSSYDN